MTLGIYCYIDKKDNSIVYIGKDSHIDKEKRNKDHYQLSNYNQQQINRILQNNPNRYTYQVLAWNVIDQNTLNALETLYITHLNPKFNFTNGGDGIVGYTHSEETRAKMSKNHSHYWKGRHRPLSFRKNLSETRKGENNPMYRKNFSKEHRKKISEANKGEKHPMFGKTHSEETKKKISESKQGQVPPNKKEYPTITKSGFVKEKQNYAIRYNGKIIKRSICKEKLEYYLQIHYDEIIEQGRVKE